MGVNVAGAGLSWVQLNVHNSCSSSQALASSVSSPLTSARLSNRTLRCVRKWKSSLFGAPSTNLYRSTSFEIRKPRVQSLQRACSANSDAFPDEDYAQMLQEIVIGFQHSYVGDDDDVDDNECTSSTDGDSGMMFDSVDTGNANINQASNSFPKDFEIDLIEPPWLRSQQDWSPGEETIPASIEWKAACVDLPLSVRIIQKKKQWGEGVKVVKDAAYCSVKKAFSSMVFMIRELHRYSLQMRELIQYQDLQEILSRVQTEMHASFVWLFQQVFSPTPTLMMYVMMLLANYTVYSMGNNVAFAAVSPVSYLSPATESASFAEDGNKEGSNFNSSILKSFPVSSPSAEIVSIGGNVDDGGKFTQNASRTEGGDKFKNSDHLRSVIPDEISHAMMQSDSSEETSVESSEDELKLWNSILEEAAKMQKEFRDEALDHDTTKIFVSPFTASVVEDDCTDYLRTELLYQTSIARDPSNALLLANYAQFLYLVAREFERAEYYFKKATSVKPPDAEAFNKYAMFLWMVKKDLWGAEETYLEAISADPSNSHYTASYAHFLWETGAEDTCYPLNSATDESITSDA